MSEKEKEEVSWRKLYRWLKREYVESKRRGDDREL